MNLRKVIFAGGLDQTADPSKLDLESAYWLLINSRLRRRIVDGVRKPRNLNAPSPAIGLAGIGNNLVMFGRDGAAYYQTYTTSTPPTWNNISGYAGSTEVDKVWAIGVPSSSVNYMRKANAAKELTLSDPLAVTSGGLFVTDGLTQSKVIFQDGSVSTLGTYDAWTSENPSYVPIGINPVWDGVQLWVSVKDSQGKYTLIKRSVSGQPFNFVIEVDNDGNKAGNQDRLAYSVSQNEMTGMYMGAEGVIVGTLSASFLLRNLTDKPLIFGEYQLGNIPLPNTYGFLNTESVGNINGETIFIHTSGIIACNVAGLINLANNSYVFSKPIDRLLDGITQTVTAFGDDRDYAYFAVTTIYGPAVLVYDKQTKLFISVDQYPDVGAIVKFVTLVVNNRRRLFFYTTAGSVFEHEPSTGDILDPQIYFGDLTPMEEDRHALSDITVTIGNIVEDGYIEARTFCDQKQASDVQIRKITAQPKVSNTGENIPFNTYLQAGDTWTATIKFDNQKATPGYRAGLWLSWSTGSLMDLEVTTVAQAGNRNAGSDINVSPQTLVVLGDDGVVNANRTAIFTAIKQLDPAYVIGTGDHSYESGTEAEVAANLIAYWGQRLRAGTWNGVSGNHDLDTTTGKAFYEDTNQPKLQVVSTRFVDCFLFTSGIDTAGTQVEATNLNEATIENSEQAVELKRLLSESTAPFKFVFWHHPPYTNGSAHYPGTVSLRALAAQLRSYGVQALFCGHTHAYERYKMADGLPIIMTGTGGRGLDPKVETSTIGASQIYINSYGYTRLTTGPMMVVVEFVDINGNVLDVYHITK